MSDTEPIGISNSEISTFTDCRRRWYFTYYRKLKPTSKDYTGPLALGSRVHRALELHYSDGVELLDVWADLVEADRDIMVTNGQSLTTFDNEADLGRIMLEGYEQWVAETGFDSDVNVVSSEEKLAAPMLGGKVMLQAKMDQRVQRKADGVRLVRDFKTTAQFSNLTKTAHLNPQLLTYMLIEHLLRGEGERCDGGQFIMLRKVKRTASAKPPFYGVVEVRHNIFTMRNFWARINAQLQDMVNAREALDAGADPNTVVYPRPSNDCSWKCNFYAICPMMDDGSAIDDAINDQFSIGNPYDYYADEYKFGE